MPDKKRKDEAWFEDGVSKVDNEELKRAEVRREQVYELYFMRNLTQRTIATMLTVHPNTIYNDIKHIRKHGAEYQKTTSVDERIGEQVMRFRATQSELWMLYSTCKKDKDKQRYLELFHKCSNDMTKFMLEIGMIPKTPSRSKIEVSMKEIQEMSDTEVIAQRERLIKYVRTAKVDLDNGRDDTDDGDPSVN